LIKDAGEGFGTFFKVKKPYVRSKFVKVLGFERWLAGLFWRITHGGADPQQWTGRARAAGG
jgi:hypothetical protein